MRIILIVLLLSGVCAFDNCSQAGIEHPVEGPAAAVQTTNHIGVGSVTDLDARIPMIEINHEDIKGLMPAMQMRFSVKDKALLDGIKVGDRIEFSVENGVGGMRVTSIRKL